MLVVLIAVGCVAQQTSTPDKNADSTTEAQELAKKLSNPVASLISVPLQSNFDFGMGTGSGWRYTLNVQPVIPIRLSDKWNLISRTIIPIIHQGNVTGPETSQSGLGDTTQSFFFSPNKTEPFIWAIGPVALIPTATDAQLGTQKWGLGPTALVLKQKEGWTYGMLNTESTYRSSPKLVRFGKQPVSFGGGLKCWVTQSSGCG